MPRGRRTTVRRSPLRPVAGLVMLLVLAGLAGCGSDDDGGVVVGDDPDAPVSSPPDQPAGGYDDPAGSGGGARIVEPTPGLDGVVDTAIDSFAETAEDELEVRFYGGVEACYGVDQVAVEETDTEVRVTVRTGSRPAAAGQACIEIAELQAVVVGLDAPLGDRAVIDGSSGSPVPPD